MEDDMIQAGTDWISQKLTVWVALLMAACFPRTCPSRPHHTHTHTHRHTQTHSGFQSEALPSSTCTTALLNRYFSISHSFPHSLMFHSSLLFCVAFTSLPLPHPHPPPPLLSR